MEPVRISKLLAERGLCSRREADSYIERGWVLLDGEVVTELGTKAYPHQDIALKRQAQSAQTARVTILLNKPVGYVSGQAESGYRPAASLVAPQTQWSGDKSPVRFAPSHLYGLAPAGRLDIDSQGLLVLTQDGRIARALVGEDSTIEKEYLVRVQGHLSEGGLALLNHGLALDGHELRPAKVSWQNEDQLRFILREGRKRQIRRMCEMVGLKVVGLKRVRIGNIRLGDLPPGEWRYLGRHEHLEAPEGAKAPKPAAKKAAPRRAAAATEWEAPRHWDAAEAPSERKKTPSRAGAARPAREGAARPTG
ncbi:rRNA pseudouridine synthase, partial [Achromobacter sp. GG226]|nr:rRNA pseudouridine synthase [Verticiella sp. GG226]